uniref:Uncharacterized protein n=1 Tax=Ignisphaera aggregans TaxID=334771 RepID=A0A7C4FHH0_9CREN
MVAVNTSLLFLGLNIVIISILLSLYGFFTGDSGLVGIAASLGLAGGVIAAYSRVPQDPATASLLSYSKTLVNAASSALEDLDLLESTICIAKRGAELLLVYSKAPCPTKVDPGLGFASGSPYLAIPIELPGAGGGAEALSSSTAGEPLERVLRSLLVEEFALCRSVRVDVEGESYRVYITGLAEFLKDFTRYPVDPYTVLVLSTLAQATPAECVRVVQRSYAPEGLLLIARVERSCGVG